MNAIWEPLEPITENCTLVHLIPQLIYLPVYSIVVINQFNSERYILIQNEIYFSSVGNITGETYFFSVQISI